jgi:hypothetical protein
MTEAEIIASDGDKYVVVLPTWGSPYILGIYKKSGKDNLPLLQKAVNGFIEPFKTSILNIHPMFFQENPRWFMARQFLRSKYTKVYVNEDGVKDCSPNMATIIINPHYRVSGCPHLFGDVCLLVPKKVFDALCANPASMTLHRNPDVDDEPSWEFEDDEEEEKYMKEFEEKGYDFNEGNGFCYMAKMA